MCLLICIERFGDSGKTIVDAFRRYDSRLGLV